MDEFRSLLERFWIRRTEDKELYFSLKKRIQNDPDFRRFLSDNLGWNILMNEDIIKLEKVPPCSMPWMGIERFSDPLDYCLLCAVFLFLSDLDDGAFFLLSSLTDAVESFLAEIRPVNWTSFSDRKALVRTLQFLQQVGVLIAYDGNSEGFQRERTQEVLYENTGLSRYFPRHFNRDILSCQSADDFERILDDGLESSRQRTRRVYRNLTLNPAVYRNGSDDSDFDYIKNQRNNLGRRLNLFLRGELYVNADGAYFILDESDTFGETYPGRPGRRLEADATLAVCAHLREQITAREVYIPGEDGAIPLTRKEFVREVEFCRNRWGEGWGKTLRELTTEQLAQRLISFMSGWALLEEKDGDLALLPASGKWIGRYAPLWEEGQRENVEIDSVKDAKADRKLTL